MIKYILAIILLASNAFAAFEYDGTGDSHVANNPNAGDTDGYTVCLEYTILAIQPVSRFWVMA